MKYFKHIPKSISKLHSDIFPIRAKGSFVFTKDKSYLDLTTGIGVLSTGHNHPYIIHKVKQQLEKYVHIPQQVFQSHPAQVELTHKLIKTFKNDDYKDLDNVFYVSSGSEAIDNAIKIARVYTGKSNIITMNRGFHGRTLGALSITSSNTTCKQGITPLIPNIFFCDDMKKSSIDKILNFQSSPKDTAGIIIEPVQGEGGIFSADKEFLKYVQEICNKNNIMLITDEVQCGAMRTGNWWNFQEKEIKPDLVTFAKGIASGYPIGGVIGPSDIMNILERGTLGGTYGGNAICSVAASATIDLLNDKYLQSNVSALGAYIFQRLKKLNGIKEVRQYGLMIGVELEDELSSGEIVGKLRENGILVLLAGNRGQYIRILPPLNITKNEVDLFLYHFENIINNI